MKDINGIEIQLGDMLKFKSDKYTTELGIVKSLSIVSGTSVYVTICGGGGTGNRMINASKAEKVNNEN